MNWIIKINFGNSERHNKKFLEKKKSKKKLKKIFFKKMTLYNDVRIFIISDIIFICYFLVGFIVEFGSIYEVFSYILTIGVVLSYVYLLPYFTLVLTTNSYKLTINNEWNLKNLNLSIIIWARNFFLVFLFAVLAVTKTAHLDLHHIILHLNAFQKTSLIIFFIFLFLSLIVVSFIVIQHKNGLYKVFNTIVATININDKKGEISDGIDLSKAHLNQFNAVYLTPSSNGKNERKMSNPQLVEKITASASN